MKFSAQILTEEFRFDDQTSSRRTPVHFIESDSMSFTIHVRCPSAENSPYPRRGRTSQLKSSLIFDLPEEVVDDGPLALAANRRQRDARRTQISQTESVGGGQSLLKQRRQDEEELRRRNAMRRPSRKISREGDYLVIQDKIGIKTTQSGALQIKEVRCKIGSDEYFALINNM